MNQIQIQLDCIEQDAFVCVYSNAYSAGLVGRCLGLEEYGTQSPANPAHILLIASMQILGGKNQCDGLVVLEKLLERDTRFVETSLADKPIHARAHLDLIQFDVNL